MRFTKSQRQLHDHNFNPPCNYYNIDKKQQKNILHGTLAGPILINAQKNTFGFNKRFQENPMKENPGPGQYFYDKKQIVYDFKQDLTNPKAFLKNTFRNQQKNPSIPYKILSQQNLDEEDKKFLKQLSLIQNPARAAQFTHKKDPSFTFSKSPRRLLNQKDGQKIHLKLKNPPANGLFPQIEQIDEQIYQTNNLRAQLNQNRNSKNKKTLILYNETIKKAAKKRNQIINSIQPDYIPSLQIIELMSKMRTKYNPGPGSYQVNKKDFFNNQIDAINDCNKKGTIFSTVKRFNVDKKDILGPGVYNVNYDSLSKKGGLMSKQDRKLSNLKNKIDIEHRFYINPDSAVNSSFNKVQRSSSCINLKRNTKNLQFNQVFSGFGSNSKRFSTAATIENNDQQKKQQLTEYQIKKKNQFKIQLKAKIKRLNSEDRRSTKQDSGLLGISTMLSIVD